MNNWSSKSLGDAVWAVVPSAQIEGIFQPIFMSAGKPTEMAVFTRLESEGRMHCEVIAYFSPAASELAKAFDAEACVKPSRTGLSLLAGSQESFQVLFTEGEQ